MGGNRPYTASRPKGGKKPLCELLKGIISPRVFICSGRDAALLKSPGCAFLLLCGGVCLFVFPLNVHRLQLCQFAAVSSLGGILGRTSRVCALLVPPPELGCRVCQLFNGLLYNCLNCSQLRARLLPPPPAPAPGKEASLLGFCKPVDVYCLVSLDVAASEGFSKCEVWFGGAHIIQLAFAKAGGL